MGTEDVRRAETECGVPFPEELVSLYGTFDGGELHGDVTLFPLHGPEGAPSVLEKSRLKLEGLPAAGVWRIGVKEPHRQLFAARKSAMAEQADSPLPGWAESLSGDDWIFGTWETEKRELRLYRSLQTMLEVLVPPVEVEEFGDRTYARALSAVQGALSDLSVEYDEEQRPMAAEAEEEEAEALELEVEEGGEEEEAGGVSDEALQKPVVAAAERRVVQLLQIASEEQAESEAAPVGRVRSAVKKAAAVAQGAAKAVAAAANVAAMTVVGGATSKAGAGARAPAKKAAAKKAPAKKAPAKKAPAKKAPAKKAPAKKAPAKKAPAKKAPAKKKAAARGRR